VLVRQDSAPAGAMDVRCVGIHFALMNAMEALRRLHPILFLKIAMFVFVFGLCVLLFGAMTKDLTAIWAGGLSILICGSIATISFIFGAVKDASILFPK